MNKTTVLLSLLLMFPGIALAQQCNRDVAELKAIKNIEYVRREYAKATDKIGEASDSAVSEGRGVYHRIFTPKAEIGAGGTVEPAVGPDAWADIVLGALAPLGPTQHLIGTQVVTDLKFELDENCQITSGSAKMESYLQAWHEQKDEKVWLFLGTYFDVFTFTAGVGWQIEKMDLIQVAGETRYMDAAVAYAGKKK